MAKRVYTQLAALTVFLSPVLAVPVMAQAARSSAAVAPMPRAETAQIDGIMSNIVDDLWKETDEYWHHGDYPRIVDLDRIIVMIDPSFQECYSTGGWLMDSLGRRSDAEAFYKLSIKNNPNMSGPYYDLGMFYMNTTKNYRAAVVVLRRGVATNVRGAGEDKNRMLSAKLLAHAYEHSGNLTASLKTWQSIKKRWPKAPAVDSNLRRVRAKINVTSAG